jgi:thiol-disulfide isomerase/thioredoxin
MRPRFQEVEKKYPEIETIALDIDLDEEASNYNVGHILPVFIIFNNDVEVERLIGEQKTETLIKAIENNMTAEE